MFFGICFSEFSPEEVLCAVEGDTLEEVIAQIHAEDIDFDDYFENNRITIIEGDTLQLHRVSRYEILPE